MRNVFFGFLLLVSNSLFSQELCDLYSRQFKDLYWYGVDYSAIYLPPSYCSRMDWEELSVADLPQYFSLWNALIVQDYRKYNMCEMFRKKKRIDTASVNGVNRSLDVMELFQKPDTDSLTLSDIEIIISAYEPSVPNGIGMVFLAREFGIRKHRATFYLVLFRNSDKSILLAQPIVTRIPGQDIRNSMFNALYEAFRLVEGKYYRKWYKQFCNVSPQE